MTALTLSYSLTQTQLDNGLTVVLNHDPLAPGAALNLWYRVGSADEVAGTWGFAHLFEHLMFSGTANVGNSEYISIIQSLGGDCNASTSFDRTNYYESVPLEALDLALWLEADRLRSLNVSQVNLDTQREVVKEEKRQRYDNQPYGDLLPKLLSLVFPPDHGYAHSVIGSMNDLDSSSLDQVRNFFATWYQPVNATLTVVSPLEDDEVLDRINRYFGDLTSPGIPERKPGQLLPALTGHPELRLHGEVPADHVYLAWRTCDCTADDYLALQQAVAILSSGTSCRFYQSLVKDQRLADAASLSDFGLARGTSLLLASAQAASGVETARLRDAIVDEIDRFRQEGPTEAELVRVRAGYEREWLSELAPMDERADNISAYTTIFSDPQRINRELEVIMSLSAEQIRDAARRWLNPDHYAFIPYLKDEN